MSSITYKHYSHQGFQKGYTPHNKGKIGWRAGVKNPKMTGNTNGFKKGHIPWNKGLKEKQIAWNKGMGVTPEDRRIRVSEIYRLWRNQVLSRDNYTCVWCGYKSRTRVNGRSDIHADHIKAFSLFPELRLSISNGRTLCITCHKKTETYGMNIKYKRTKL